MRRNLTLLGIAVTALAACAMPAVASAAFTLTDHDGKVQPEAAIIGTSTNAVTTDTALGPLKCAHVEITAIVTENSGTRIKAVGTAGTAAGCFAGPNTEAALIVTKPTLISLETSGEDKGSLAMTFIADVGPFECHFHGEGAFTYGTGTEQDEIHISSPGITLTTDEICETEEGRPHFHADFTLTTEDEDGDPAGVVWVEPGA